MRTEAFLMATGLAPLVLGHGYLTIPKSRTRLGSEVSYGGFYLLSTSY
jgi:hypothetical protein